MAAAIKLSRANEELRFYLASRGRRRILREFWKALGGISAFELGSRALAKPEGNERTFSLSCVTSVGKLPKS